MLRWLDPYRSARLALVGALIVAAPGCGANDQAPDVCAQTNAELRACELDELDCDDPQQNCVSVCFTALSCDELKIPFEDPGVTACLWHCAPRFECADGSEIYAAWRCDGEADCAGAEDESDCDD